MYGVEDGEVRAIGHGIFYNTCLQHDVKFLLFDNKLAIIEVDLQFIKIFKNFRYIY